MSSEHSKDKQAPMTNITKCCLAAAQRKNQAGYVLRKTFHSLMASVGGHRADAEKKNPPCEINRLKDNTDKQEFSVFRNLRTHKVRCNNVPIRKPVSQKTSVTGEPQCRRRCKSAQAKSTETQNILNVLARDIATAAGGNPQMQEVQSTNNYVVAQTETVKNSDMKIKSVKNVNRRRRGRSKRYCFKSRSVATLKMQTVNVVTEPVKDPIVSSPMVDSQLQHNECTKIADSGCSTSQTKMKCVKKATKGKRIKTAKSSSRSRRRCSKLNCVKKRAVGTVKKPVINKPINSKPLEDTQLQNGESTIIINSSSTTNKTRLKREKRATTKDDTTKKRTRYYIKNLSDAFIQHFIDSYRDQECLWNKKSENYHKRAVRRVSYEMLTLKCLHYGNMPLVSMNRTKYLIRRLGQNYHSAKNPNFKQKYRNHLWSQLSFVDSS